MPTLLLACFGATGLGARSALAEPFRAVKKGSWKQPGTWDRGAGFPAEGDSVTIEGQTVLVDHDLTGANAPDLIVLSNGGVLEQPGKGHQIASSVVMAGGTWLFSGHWTADRHVTGNVTLAADSVFSGDRGTVLRVQGLVRGEHRLTVTGRDSYKSSGMTLSLERDNPHTGGITLSAEPIARIVSAAPQALGLGPVLLEGGELSFTVSPDYGDKTPPTVTVREGASIRLMSPTMNLPLVFDGGRIGVTAGGTGTREVTGPIKLTDRGMIPYTSRNRHVILRGKISGPGGIRTTKNDYYYASTNATSVVLAGDRNTYTGGTIIETGGGLQVTGNQALGGGPVTVNSAGVFSGRGGGLRGGLSVDAAQNYPPGQQPRITINPNAAVYVNLPSDQALQLDVELHGGELAGAWNDAKQNQLAGEVRLTADSYLGGADGSLEVTGSIRGNYRLTRRASIDSGEGLEKKCRDLPGPVILSHPENEFRELYVESGPVGVTQPDALGHGAVTLWPEGSLLLTAKEPGDWVLGNQLRGAGAIRVENGTPGFTLTLLGSVVRPSPMAPPIANLPEAAEELAPMPASLRESLSDSSLLVEGNFAFLPWEQRPPVLCIEIARRDAGIVSGRLHVTGVVSGLEQAVLDVVVHEDVSPEDLADCELEILTTETELGTQRFRWINWDPAWQGRVDYGSNGLRLTGLKPTATFERRVRQSLRYGELVEKLAPRFSIESVGIGGLLQLKEYAGRNKVLRTHPVSPEKPCVLRAPVRLPKDKPAKLMLEVAARQPAGDWQLVVKANGRVLHQQRIAAAGAENGWTEVSVDLAPLAGQKVLLEIENRAAHWAGEDAFGGEWRSYRNDIPVQIES